MVIMVEIERKKKKESRGSFELEMGCPIGLLGAECNYYSFYYVISVFLIIGNKNGYSWAFSPF